MPIRFNARSIDRGADRRLHRQLADLVRAAIEAGELRPGENLPSEHSIAEATGLNRTTVRDGLNILLMEGRITKSAGMPTRVIEPPPVRHMSTSRYADELATLKQLGKGKPHPRTSAFTTDHHVAWADHTVEATYDEDVAGTIDAERLGIKTGTPVLRRHLLKLVSGAPVQLQESIMPLDMVEGTPVADPDRQPWPGGTIAELYSLDIVVTRVVEEVYARMPTGAERHSLDMGAAAPVFEIVRIFHAGDRPVECSTVVVPAARNILRFETLLP